MAELVFCPEALIVLRKRKRKRPGLSTEHYVFLIINILKKQKSE